MALWPQAGQLPYEPAALDVKASTYGPRIGGVVVVSLYKSGQTGRFRGSASSV